MTLRLEDTAPSNFPSEESSHLGKVPTHAHDILQHI